MNIKRIFVILNFTLSITILSGVSLCAQTAPIQFHRETYMMDSGTHDGLLSASHIAYREVVHVPGVPWMQLRFSDFNLGKHSYITITSLEDGARQYHNAKSLTDYRNYSALFNGDSVEVELHVAPGESGVFFRLEELSVGEAVNGDVEPADICGSDDRVSSTDPRVARIEPTGGTAFIISNGTYLSAGHCSLSASTILEFNVPASTCDGFKRHPPVEDQYSIDSNPPPWGNFTQVNNGLGDDWAVFECLPNSNTGLLPVQAQGAFYRVSRDSNPTTVRVTGYGEDDDPPGCGTIIPKLNADNETLQTHSGPFNGEISMGPSNVHLRYTVDTRGGNSGSPVIVGDSTLTIGIHTNGGCDNVGYNSGTSFENDNLENTIETFFGAYVVYVDKGHPIIQEEGKVFRPYDTVAEAVTAVPSGGIISIVRGSYSDKITINKPVMLVAPVGTVIIGI
jgi:hypothetical protein